jgi:hypothetical protein
MTPQHTARAHGPQVAAAVAALVASAAAEPVSVIALTDEEIAALDGGPDVDYVAPRPWLDAQDGTRQEVACEVALRGLAARGLVLPRLDPRDHTAALAVHRDVRAVLAMRGGARALVFAQRQAAGENCSRVAYVHDGAVLEENVSPGGLHAFSVVPASLTAGRFAGFCDPAGAARTDCGQRTLTVSLTDIAAGAGPHDLQDVRYATVIARVGGTGDQDRLTVYARDDGVTLAQPADATEKALAFTEVSAQALTVRLEALLGAAGED